MKAIEHFLGKEKCAFHLQVGSSSFWKYRDIQERQFFVE